MLTATKSCIGIMCCRMLSSRAYMYGQVHSADSCCTYIGVS
ncbi:MAG: hypothetical protein ACI3W5_06015 [Faecousia sp.]